LEGRVVGAGRGHDDDVQVVPGDDALTGGELLVDDGAGDVAEAATPGAERGQRDEHLGTTGARLQPGGGDLLQGSPEPVHHRGELAADLTAAADDVDEPGGLHQLGGPAAAEAALRPVRRLQAAHGVRPHPEPPVPGGLDDEVPVRGDDDRVAVQVADAALDDEQVPPRPWVEPTRGGACARGRPAWRSRHARVPGWLRRWPGDAVVTRSCTRGGQVCGWTAGPSGLRPVRI